jgi:hypothetical protein
MRSKFFLLIILICAEFQSVAQAFSEILGRPTHSSVSMNILFDQDVEAFLEYGTQPGNYVQTTPTLNAKKDVPSEVDMTGLTGNTQYFYRTRYRLDGTISDFQAGTEHTFHTPRPAGSMFTFAIEADPHLDANSIPEAYSLTLRNILSEKPDFLFDLGDTFMSEKEPVKNQTSITARHVLFRPYFGSVCHSVPLYLILGNHEGEVGWSLNGTPGSNPVLIANTRKLYYPNPLPNLFYLGNTKEEPFVGLRENYYAFEWGDALFVVLDPYWYSLKKSEWNTTLGVEQYNWFEKTLTESKAKFKFVFCHNLVGGYTSDARGGAEYADLFEMGGFNADSTYGFDSWRPGWQKPIHTLMKENNVTVFFHGHDHFFGKQEKDGIIYQEVPQPSNRNITNLQASEYGYVTGDFLPGRGYLKVSVSPENVKIDYIRTYLPTEENATRKNGEVAYSYTLKTMSTGTGKNIASPGSSSIEQNYPNPFSKSTFINYRIDHTSPVKIKVFDIFGKEVATLVDQEKQPGFYTQTFDAGKLGISSGMYLIHFNAGSFQKSIHMVYSNN